MVTASGQFNNRSQYRLVQDCWQHAQNIGENYSDVHWALRIDESPNWGSWSASALTWNVDVHGQGWSGSTTYDFRNYDSLGLGSGGRRVYHNGDGTMSIGFSASAGGGTTIGSAGCSGGLGLSTIPRASSPTFINPGFENLILGSNSYMLMNRASGDFIHDIDWYFGSRSGRAITAAGHDGNWTPNLDFGDQIPTNNTGVGKVRSHTYTTGYGRFIGVTEHLFRVYMPDDSRTKPSFSGKSVAEANSAVTTVVGSGKYVQNLSRVKATMTGSSAKYGASVAERRAAVGFAANVVQLVGDNSSATATTSTPLTSYGASVPVTFTARDSRGFEYSETQNIEVLPYGPPVINSIAAVRALSNGTPNEDGTFIRINMSASVSSLINSTQRNRLTVKAYTRLRGASAWTLRATPVNGSSTLNYNPANGFFFSGPFAVDVGYEIRVEVIDQFSTTAWEGTVSVAGIFQHWTKDTSVSPARSVMGIGKYWEKGTLDIGGPAYMEGREVMAGNVQAMLDPNYKGPGPAKVIFLPGTTLSAEAYEWLTPYIAYENRTVEMVRMGNTWAILGHSGNDMFGGPVAIALNSPAFQGYNAFNAGTYTWREPASSRRLGSGIVVLSGLLQLVGNPATNTLVGTLPPGHRPDVTMTFPIEVADVPRAIDVNPDGTIRVRSGIPGNNYLSLDGIAFPAAGVATWTSFAFQNSWAARTTATWGIPGWWKDPWGVVWCRGMIGNGSTAENAAMVTLPAGTRPAQDTHVRTANQDNFGLISAKSAGNIAYKNGSSGNDGMSLAAMTIVTPDAISALPWTDIALTGGFTRFNTDHPVPKIVRRPDGLIMTEGLLGGGGNGRSITKGLAREYEMDRRMIVACATSNVRGRLDIGTEPFSQFINEITASQVSASWTSLDGLKWVPGR